MRNVTTVYCARSHVSQCHHLTIPNGAKTENSVSTSNHVHDATTASMTNVIEGLKRCRERYAKNDDLVRSTLSEKTNTILGIG